MGATGKASLRQYVEALGAPDGANWASATNAFFAPHASINVVHPFNEMVGAEAYFANVLGSLRDAFSDLLRSDYIAFGGEFEGAEWVTATGYYTGRFDRPWLGIRPTGTLMNLRFG